MYLLEKEIPERIAQAQIQYGGQVERKIITINIFHRILKNPYKTGLCLTPNSTGLNYESSLYFTWRELVTVSGLLMKSVSYQSLPFRLDCCLRRRYTSKFGTQQWTHLSKCSSPNHFEGLKVIKTKAGPFETQKLCLLTSVQRAPHALLRQKKQTLLSQIYWILFWC